LIESLAKEACDDLEAEGLAHVFGGRSEDLPVDIDQAIAPTMPGLPSDGSGDGVPPRVPDPLVQVEVADWVRDDRRTEHLILLLV
jgi:hypothetical protein